MMINSTKYKGFVKNILYTIAKGVEMMKINITARNTGIKDSFRARVEKKLSKFDKFFGDNAQSQVTVIHSGDHETVEVTIKSEGLFFRAERTADEREEALEAVVDSLFRQIVKNKNKLEKRMKSASFTPEFIEEMYEPDEYKVVKTKRFPVKPMEVEEAILQMNMLEHEFFVFRNAQSNEINVVYKRRDGNYALIEPEAE